tara:strand:- start:6206 stop:6646 length:441 start_codon:yes stop_codon:yes gene_type:complete
MARITVEDCIDKFESRFELVLVASNRARKLHSGENPTVDRDNDKNTVIALREIADETVSIDEMKSNLIEEYQTVSSQNEENLSLEYSDSNENYSDENEISEDLEEKNDDMQESIEETINLEDSTNNEENDEIVEETNDEAAKNIEN